MVWQAARRYWSSVDSSSPLYYPNVKHSSLMICAVQLGLDHVQYMQYFPFGSFGLLSQKQHIWDDQIYILSSFTPLIGLKDPGWKPAAVHAATQHLLVTRYLGFLCSQVSKRSPKQFTSQVWCDGVQDYFASAGFERYVTTSGGDLCREAAWC